MNSVFKKRTLWSIAIVAVILMGNALFGGARSSAFSIARPSTWFAADRDRDINFYLGSATYMSYSQGGVGGRLYLGPYWTSGTLGSSPSDTGDMGYYGKPEGKLFAIWATHTEVEDWSDTEEHFYYAASPIGSHVIAPERKRKHWYYQVYAFMGHKFAYDQGVTTEEAQAPSTQSFTLTGGRGTGYRIGDQPGLYYLLQSYEDIGNRVPVKPWTVANDWQKIDAIEITQAQYNELACDIQLPQCTPFLSEGTSGLTPEQLAYVKAHPISKDDFSALIDRIKSFRNPWK